MVLYSSHCFCQWTGGLSLTSIDGYDLEAIKGNKKAGTRNGNKYNIGKQLQKQGYSNYVWHFYWYKCLSYRSLSLLCKLEKQSSWNPIFTVVNATTGEISCTTLKGCDFGLQKTKHYCLVKTEGLAWAALRLCRHRKGQCLNGSTKSTVNPRKQMPQLDRLFACRGNCGKCSDNFGGVAMQRIEITFNTVQKHLLISTTRHLHRPSYAFYGDER